MIAEVIVNSRANELNRTFDYGVPDNLDVVLRYEGSCTIWCAQDL